MKSVYKFELAEAAGVSSRTFRRWLCAHRDELLNLGVKCTDKILSPKAAEWIRREYGIDL